MVPLILAVFVLALVTVVLATLAATRRPCGLARRSGMSAECEACQVCGNPAFGSTETPQQCAQRCSSCPGNKEDQTPFIAKKSSMKSMSCLPWRCGVRDQ